MVGLGQIRVVFLCPVKEFLLYPQSLKNFFENHTDFPWGDRSSAGKVKNRLEESEAELSLLGDCCKSQGEKQQGQEWME